MLVKHLLNVTYVIGRMAKSIYDLSHVSIVLLVFRPRQHNYLVCWYQEFAIAKNHLVIRWKMHSVIPM